MGGTSEVISTNPVPRGAALAIGVVLAGVLLSVATGRLSGVEVRAPDAPAVLSRDLRFEDGPAGSVLVLDAASGRVLEQVEGEAGFLRGSLRALSRERQRRGLGSGPAFTLTQRADGRLTLADPATGERIDLESFGPTNAAVYLRLLQAPLPPATTSLSVTGTGPVATAGISPSQR
jgi:putative photosynthetic complex assembly protein